MVFNPRKKKIWLKNKGFTLIELLVVIAIIGVLASIGLFYMNQARNKANDAVTIAQLSMARDSAQIFYESHGSYNGSGGNVQKNVMKIIPCL